MSIPGLFTAYGKNSIYVYKKNTIFDICNLMMICFLGQTIILVIQASVIQTSSSIQAKSKI